MCHQSTRQYSTLPDNSREHWSETTKKMVKRGFDPYHCEYECDSLDWNRREVFMEDNPVSTLALEPHQIDSPLDDRVSV
jgi:hypothetical protein